MLYLADTVPTIGFNCERVRGSLGSSAGATFLVWDVGGQERIRPLWRTYTRNTDGIIFVLDSGDHRSLEQARHELHRTLAHQEPGQHTPLLVLANKQDLPMALTEKQVVSCLKLKQLRLAIHTIPTLWWHCLIPCAAHKSSGAWC